MAKQVSKTYGSALFEVAKEKNALDTILEEVLFVKQTMLDNQDLNKLLLHPNIEKEEKIKLQNLNLQLYKEDTTLEEK